MLKSVRSFSQIKLHLCKNMIRISQHNTDTIGMSKQMTVHRSADPDNRSLPRSPCWQMSRSCDTCSSSPPNSGSGFVSLFVFSFCPQIDNRLFWLFLVWQKKYFRSCVWIWCNTGRMVIYNRRNLSLFAFPKVEE